MPERYTDIRLQFYNRTLRLFKSSGAVYDHSFDEIHQRSGNPSAITDAIMTPEGEVYIQFECGAPWLVILDAHSIE